MQGYFDDKITLRTMKNCVKDGFARERAVSSREVYADKESVGWTEFYLAAQAGRESAVRFKIRSADYGEEQELEYKGEIYDVLRTYQKDRDFIILTCSRRCSA